MVVAVAAAEVAEVVDSAAKADGDRAVMAVDTVADTDKVDTVVVMMDTADMTIMVVVDTEATAATTIVDTVVLMIITRYTMANFRPCNYTVASLSIVLFSSVLS